MSDNPDVYRRADVVAGYAGRRELHPAEAAIFPRMAQELAAARLLDIGVGAGRTTAYLAPRVREYVGLEYSPELAAVTARSFPALDIAVGDVRDLTAYGEGSFDVVLFSFNGLDTLGHDDRLLALAQVRRVLRVGGAFVFSSHNKGHRRFDLLPWQRPDRVGRTMLRKSWEAVRATPTRRRLRAGVVHTPTWSVVNDDAHGWSLLQYYIGVEDQVAQLHEAGFSDVTFHDWAGQPGVRDDSAVWVHYLAR